MSFYLASTSPARLATLRAGGVQPVVIPSHVDELAVVARAEAARGRPLAAAEVVAVLAEAKANAVATMPGLDGLVLGCDSVFEVGGTIYGKPHTPEEALRRWRLQRGATGTLFSGHHLIEMRGGTPGASVSEVASAVVTFAGDLDEQEIDDYVATGEPLEVAGAFTIDGLGGPFIRRIEGDPSTVVGLSLSTVRTLVRRLGVSWTSLWARKL
ncbi:MAG TPA: Maf family protein [Microbacteriaceae bacterium]|nr:Maf family protein [Microbacteriaceae bacterium]